MFLFIVLLLNLSTGVFSKNPESVKDFLNYLTKDEVDSLQKQIDQIKSSTMLDVVIVITDDTKGKSSMAYADDYYDYNNYGIDSEHSGLLLLINMENRELWISTVGKAIDKFNDARISKMSDRIYTHLSQNKYYNGCVTFLKDIVNYTTPSTYLNRVKTLIFSFWVYIGALVISILVTVLLSLSSKGKNTTNHLTYEYGNSFNLVESRDDFLRETTTRTKIQSSSSSGSGSSTHRSSSGRRHGGGGRRF